VLIRNLQIELPHGFNAMPSPSRNNMHWVVHYQVGSPGCFQVLECFGPGLQMGFLNDAVQFRA
jgi:hypothetical protein